MLRSFCIGFASLLFIVAPLIGQDAEKSIVNQGILIDALKELQIGNIEKAQELFIKIKYLPETKGISNYYLSRIYRGQGKYDEALSAIDASIEADSKNKWYLVMKANLAEDLGQFASIGKVYQSLYELEPDNYTYYDNAALNFLKAEDPINTLIVLDAAQLKFGLVPPIAIKKAKILSLDKKSKKAISLLEECLALYPGHQELIEELLLIAREENNASLLKKYQPTLKQEVNLSPTNETELSKIIESTHVNLDDKLKALIKQLSDYVLNNNKQGVQNLLPYADKLAKDFPDQVKVYAFRADLFYQLDDYVAATLNYTKCISTGVVPFSVWENLLTCLQVLKHWNALLYYSNQCMDYYPASYLPNYTWLKANYQLKNKEISQNELNTLLTKAKTNSLRTTESLILAAQIYNMMDKKVEADSAWNQALRTDYKELARLEWIVSQSTQPNFKPDVHLAKLISSDRIPPAYKNQLLAQLYFNMKDLTSARTYLEECLKFPISQNKEVYTLAATIYKSLNDIQQANLSLLRSNELSEERMEYPFLNQSKVK